MSSHLYKLTHKKDGGSATFRDATEAFELASYFDNHTLLLKDNEEVFEYLYCTEEAYECIKGDIHCDMIEQ